MSTESRMAIRLRSEPRPDVILTTESRAGGNSRRLCGTVAQVATNILRLDPGWRVGVYAASVAAAFKAANVSKKVIYQLRAPMGDGYAKPHEGAFGKRIAAVTVAGLAVEINGTLRGTSSVFEQYG